MAELKLAANFVTLTAKLDHWSLRWAAPENSGHLQIIYSDGGFFQEAEVQINEGIPMGGDWTFATFGRPHGGTSGDAEGDNTNWYCQVVFGLSGG